MIQSKHDLQLSDDKKRRSSQEELLSQLSPCGRRQSESHQNIIHILQSPLKLPLSFIFPFVGRKQFICHPPLACNMEGSAMSSDGLSE